MADPLITELEIRCALDAGHDGLFPKVLKALNSHVAPVLAQMFNLSLRTAHVPEDWRLAIVTPVAKIETSFLFSHPRTVHPLLGPVLRPSLPT